MSRARKPASRPAAAVLLATLAAASVHADSVNPWYVSLGIGWDYAENVEFDETGEILGLDLGVPVLSAALGRRVTRGWRAELELAFRHNDPEVLYEADSGAEIETDPRDRFTATSLTLNLLRDFELGIALRPYLGIGAGFARLDLEYSEIEIDGLFVQRPRRFIIDDDDDAFAVQLIAGFTAPVSRRLTLGLDYRYWRAPSAEIDNTGGQRLKVDHAVHSAAVHVRYGFTDRDSHRPRSRPASGRSSYLTTRLGGGFATDANIDDSFDNLDAFDIGPAAAVAAGYDTGGHWRFEVEAAYRANHPEIVDFSPEVGQFRARGKVHARSLMANAIYRFGGRTGVGPVAGVRPYAGAGAGIGWVDYHVKSRGNTFLNDDASAFAAQVILGIDFALTRRLTVAPEYRFWATTDLSMRQPDGSPLVTSHQVHAVLLGLSYSLGPGN